MTKGLKDGAVRSPRLEFDFADVKVPHSAFKRVVRDLEFDVAELAIVTFLMAKAFGKPYQLLPAVMLRQGEPVFLDDRRLETVAEHLPVPTDIGGPFSLRTRPRHSITSTASSSLIA